MIMTLQVINEFIDKDGIKCKTFVNTERPWEFIYEYDERGQRELDKIIQEFKSEGVNIDALEKDKLFVMKQSLEYWKQGEISGVLAMSSNQVGMAFVADNFPLLQEKGMYEEALWCAYSSINTNHHTWDIHLFNLLFSEADSDKLRKEGDPIPDKDTFTLYRGVAGNGSARRVNGISWTGSPNVAAWFALRYKMNDPTVFKVTVPKDSILIHYNGRKEDEYILRLPLPVKPKRVVPMPEPYKDKEELLKA